MKGILSRYSLIYRSSRGPQRSAPHSSCKLEGGLTNVFHYGSEWQGKNFLDDVVAPPASTDLLLGTEIEDAIGLASMTSEAIWLLRAKKGIGSSLSGLLKGMDFGWRGKGLMVNTISKRKSTGRG